jgi:adenine-specific DNA-methyltransferase
MPAEQKPHRDKVASESPDLREDLRRGLRALVPEAFAEGRIDAEKLRALLGESGDAGPERYSFSWAGKRDAIAMLQVPTRATLVPDRANSVNFDDAQHVFIEGENLEVLKVLYRSYFGRVKMIYIDPPYNTGNDFIYPDDFSDPLDNYLRITGQKTGEGDYTTSQVDRSGRIHSAWLSMMYPRLAICRQLLRDDGIFFASIDDHEAANFRGLLDGIFGEENFVAQFVWKSRQSEDTRAITGVSTDHEYVLCYRRSANAALRGTEKDLEKFSNPDDDARGEWRSADLTGLATKQQRPNLHYDLVNPATGIKYACPPKGWRYDRKTMAKKIAEGRILWPHDAAGRPRHKLFLSEMKNLFKNVSSVITEITTADGTRETNRLIGDDVFPFPKPSRLLGMLVEQTTEEDDLVLDFFAGSSPMGQAVMAVNSSNGGGGALSWCNCQNPQQKIRMQGRQALRQLRILAARGSLPH